MHKIIKVFAFLFIFMSTVAIGGKQKERSDILEITFGLYPSDDPKQMSRQFIPILRYLQQKVQKEDLFVVIKIKGYVSYSDGIKALVKGEIDFARFGSATYVMAKEENPDIRLIAMEQVKGEKKHKGVFIVKKDSPIDAVEDLKGKTFAFGNELSAIGSCLSKNALLKQGINKTQLKKVYFLERHDLVAQAVLSGKYDAGVVKEDTYLSYSSTLKKIGDFSNVTNPWVAREGLPEEIFTLLQKALLELALEKDQQVLNSLRKDGFFMANDRDFDPVRLAMKTCEKF